MAEQANGGWRARPVVLAALGAAAALIVQQLVEPGRPYKSPPLAEWRIALSTAVAAAAMVFGFVVERVRMLWAAIFAGVIGVLVGFVLYWNGIPDGEVFGDWRTWSLFLSIAIAAPLFQVARDEGAARWPYADVHAHAWTNVVLWFASWLFTGIVFAMTFLLSELFQLIGIKLIKDLLDKSWFDAILLGAAFGAALGLFRERDRVVRLLQRVATAVLGVLAPVLGAGLLLFLVALPFTGLGALWAATKATTPILLACIIGALILANAVIGDGEADEEVRNPVLRAGAAMLAVAMLPLAVIAAIATGLRIDQYGYTPDRLWALAFVVVAVAYGVAYLVALVRGRRGWAAQVLPANLTLGFALGGLALFLALPIVSFNAISTRDQVARLESGQVSPEKFDWAALGFDFGAPGKAALKRLAASGKAGFVEPARRTLAAQSRWDVDPEQRQRAIGEAEKASRREIVVRPVAGPVPADLRAALFQTELDRTSFVAWNGCTVASEAVCQVYWRPGDETAIAVQDECAALPPAKRADPAVKCETRVDALKRVEGKWRPKGWERSGAGAAMTPADERASLAAERAAIEHGQVGIRTVTRRQLYVGDKPVGDAFE